MGLRINADALFFLHPEIDAVHEIPCGFPVVGKRNGAKTWCNSSKNRHGDVVCMYYDMNAFWNRNKSRNEGIVKIVGVVPVNEAC